MGVNYYPFGWSMPGRKFNSGDYRFGFNGMEKDDELKGEGKSYTTHFRQYDSRIARWLSNDPIFHPDMSTYTSLDNSPIVKVDPNGDDAKIRKTKKNGKTHYKVKYRGVLVDKTKSLSNDELQNYKQAITDQLKRSYTGSEEAASWSIKVKLRIGDNPKRGLFKNESSVNLVENGMKLEAIGVGMNGDPQKVNLNFRTGSSHSTNTLDTYVNISKWNQDSKERASLTKVGNTASHEIGHTMGLPHPISSKLYDASTNLPLIRQGGDPFIVQYSLIKNDNLHSGNLMLAGPVNESVKGTTINMSQIIHMYTDFRNKKINKLTTSGGTEPWGTYPSDRNVYRFYFHRSIRKQTLKLIR